MSPHLFSLFLLIISIDSMSSRWNLGFCNVNSIVGKFGALRAEIEAVNYDFYGLVETKIDDSIIDADLSIPGYDLHRCDRTRHGGGIAFYIKSGFPCVRLKDHSEYGIRMKGLETLALRIGNARDFIICVVVYIPRTSPAAIDGLHDYLIQAFGRNHHRLVLIGDFNANFLTDSPARRRLLHMVSAIGGKQTVDGPTRKDRSLLDLVILGDESRHVSTSIMPPFSDHNAISVILGGHFSKRPPDVRRMWDLRRANWPAINDRIRELGLPQRIISSDTIDLACVLFTNLILSVFNELIPRKLFRMDRHTPWCPAELRALIIDKNASYKLWKRTGSVDDRNRFRTLSKQCRKAIHRAKIDYIVAKFGKCTTSGEFWAEYRRLSPDNRHIPVLIDNFNQPLMSSGERVEALNCQFASNFNHADYGLFDPPPPDLDDFGDYFISHEFVFTELRRLKIRSAPGVDGLTSGILREVAPSITPALVVLFNRSIREELFPSSWKCANVVPIPKAGDPSSIKSYRPISLLPILSKILERHIDRLIRSRIRLSSDQHGFCKKRGTNSALISASQFIHDSLNSRESKFVVGVFLDIKKAFDQIPHVLLLRKLATIRRLPATIIRWLLSYLSNRSQRVVIGDCASTSTDVPSGVPQGSVLGPSLFVIFFDSLLIEFRQRFPSAHLQAYADDTGLFVALKHIQEIPTLVQPMVDFIAEWVSSAGLDFNMEKSQYIIFRYGHGKLENVPSLSLRNHDLELCTTIRFLGIVFSDDMKFSEHVSSLVRRCNSMIGALRRRLGNHLPNSAFKTVFDACIRSVLEYGSVAWDPVLARDILDLERVQRFAVRLFLRDFTISYDDALTRAGWLPLIERRKLLKVCQFYKFYHGYHEFPNRHFVHLSDFRRSTRFVDRHHLLVPRHFYDSYCQSFLYSALKLWNCIPRHIALCRFSRFHSLISEFRFQA